MKKLLVWAAAAASGLTCVAAPFSVTVRLSSGDEVLSSEEIKRITFDGAGGIDVAMTNGDDKQFDGTSFQALLFGSPQSGIPTLQAGDDGLGGLRLAGDVIINDSAESMRLYNPAGSLVAESSGSALSLKSLQQGVYVVCCGEQTLKICVK